ncbi:MAG: lipopolysaccharide transport system permease protein [Chloroflexi bacterium]|nr:MAG: lipopolysaccharide transport system permease protein [Chloroflexota bacterium]MBA4375080.1 phosphate ABC transporter permease [Anaerolinea sp.]
MKTKSIETIKKPETVLIKPVKGWVPLNLKDLWVYRELIFFLTWRDLKVRYKQSVLGVLWAILKPVMTMVVFTIFFGNFAKIPSDGVPYPIFSYTAALPWEFFAAALSVSARSMLASGGMVSKIYFPRIIVPLSSVMANLVDFLIAFVILIGMMIFYQITPTINMLWLPAFLLLAMVTALGVGLWFSALLVMYRDINYLLPFITQLWMFISPVVYPSSMVPEKWRFLYSLNPMAGVIEGFRWALLGTQQSISGGMIAISSGIALFILISGLFFFRRMERIFADMI